MKSRTRKPLAMLGLTPQEREKVAMLAQMEKEGHKVNPEREYVDNGDGEMVPKPKASKWGKEIEQKSAKVRSKNPNWITRADSDIDDLLDFLSSARAKAHLTDWEQTFYESVSAFADAKGGMTLKQYEKLADVVDRIEDRMGR